jgi:protein arginine N-methyltransferase 1
VENAEIAFFAREIIKNNGLESKITVLKGKMEDIVLPVEKVDIIISEWMGYFLLYESMLDSVLDARDKYLVKGGKMLPDRAQIYMAAMYDEDYKRQKASFWRDVYDNDMSVMTNVVLKEPCIDYLDECQYNQILTDRYMMVDLDLVNMKKSDVNFATQYHLTMKEDAQVSAIITWFDCHFENLKNPITLSTSPYAEYTHWKNTIFYIDHAMHCKYGDTISGSVAVRQSKENKRELDVKFSYHFSGNKAEPQI